MKNSPFVIAVIILLVSSFVPNNKDFLTEWNDSIAQTTLKAHKQSFCFEENGKVFGKNIDLVVKPASVTKLYTTLWSLERLKKDYRFQTQFIVKDNDLYILGGNDPFFVTENIMYAMSELAKKGFDNFDHVYFDKNFTLNWNDSPKGITYLLKRMLNTDRWNQSLDDTYRNAQNYVLRTTNSDVLEIPFFAAKKISYLAKITVSNEMLRMQHYSSTLWEHYKQVNMYSNNFYTDKVFEQLGGSSAFLNYISKKLNTNSKEIYFYTGSGLGANYTTCRVTLKMLKALQVEATQQGLELADIVAIPGVDDGTLKNRFTANEYKRHLAAKTGTLSDTSTLAGYLFSQDNILFGVFNHTTGSSKHQARKVQNSFIEYAIDSFTTVDPIVYEMPDYLSIKDIKIQFQ
jgi:D-alanyl-D-alanine carboxypeptidase/D-alanyl-D-alanine-endopeptidase (penicillin-binding protein 4)